MKYDVTTVKMNLPSASGDWTEMGEGPTATFNQDTLKEILKEEKEKETNQKQKTRLLETCKKLGIPWNKKTPRTKLQQPTRRNIVVKSRYDDFVKKETSATAHNHLWRKQERSNTCALRVEEKPPGACTT